MKDFNNFEEKEGRIDFDDYDSDDFEDDFLPTFLQAASIFFTMSSIFSLMLNSTS
jgi:hypothetical protein